MAAGQSVSQGFGCLHHSSSGMMSCCFIPTGDFVTVIHRQLYDVARNNMQRCSEECGRSDKIQMLCCTSAGCSCQTRKIELGGGVRVSEE